MDTSHKQQAAAVKLCELWGLGRDYHDEGGYYQHLAGDYLTLSVVVHVVQYQNIHQNRNKQTSVLFSFQVSISF